MIKREYGDYLQDIFDSINDIDKFISEMSFDEFTHDKKTLNAVVRSIEIIGEATKKIPKSITAKYHNIPWKKIAGSRDVLSHSYYDVDIELVWETVKKDIPRLKKEIQKILNAG